MTDKDPKDMTASELLREAVAVSESATGYWTPIGELFLLLDTCFSDGQEDLFRALADKIDAEIVKAYSEKLNTCAMRWAKANGWPDFRDGEDFGAWLERCACKKPVDDCGEPVQFGDDTDKLNGVEKFIFLRSGGGCCQMQDAEGNIHNVYPGERVKRPAPEVLGADGRPIKEGETVWSVYHNERFTVEDIHETDGVMFVHVHGDGDHRTCFKSHELTHTPPDTQQAIDDDATMPPAEYCAVRGIDLGDDPDRETATEAMVRDLLRRQRELDKRTGGDA